MSDDARLIGAGDGSVMLYCRPHRAVVSVNVSNLDAAGELWADHVKREHDGQ